MTVTMKKVSIWAIAMLLVSFMGMMSIASQAHAATPGEQNVANLGKFNAEANLGSNDLTTTIGSLVQVVLGFLGLLAVLLVLWAGFLWMTAGGNEDQIHKAKGILISAIVGLVIILSAYAITTFVLGRLGYATKTDTGITM